MWGGLIKGVYRVFVCDSALVLKWKSSASEVAWLVNKQKLGAIEWTISYSDLDFDGIRLGLYGTENQGPETSCRL